MPVRYCVAQEEIKKQKRPLSYQVLFSLRPRRGSTVFSTINRKIRLFVKPKAMPLSVAGRRPFAPTSEQSLKLFLKTRSHRTKTMHKNIATHHNRPQKQTRAATQNNPLSFSYKDLIITTSLPMDVNIFSLHGCLM